MEREIVVQVQRRFRLAIVVVAGITAIAVACYVEYQREIAEGDRRVRAFWGKIGTGYEPIRVLDALPPIESVPTIPGVEAGEKIQPDELVLGVEIGGQSRAYPINMLTGPNREIFNDELNETAIAATW